MQRCRPPHGPGLNDDLKQFTTISWAYFMPLAGVMGADMPEPMVPVPMVPVPMAEPLLEEEPDDPIPPDEPYEPDEELDESVEGVVMGAGVGTVPVSPTFLPHAPKASAAASATAEIAASLVSGLNMKFPLVNNGFRKSLALSQRTCKRNFNL